MRIIRNMDLATLTFVPVELGEEEVLAAIAVTLQPEDKLIYCGRDDDGDDGRFYILYLHAGGQAESKITFKGGLTIESTERVGGVKLTLVGTTEEDKREIVSIRDTCFFGSGGLVFLGETEVDGKKAMIFTARRCKHCNAGMLRFGACEWGVCDACAAQCEHTYVHGMIHGGDVGDMGVGEYCDKCGRGKPSHQGERQKTTIEHHLDVERELGVHIFYKNGPPDTPTEVVALGRFERRLNRSRRRSLQEGLVHHNH